MKLLPLILLTLVIGLIPGGHADSPSQRFHAANSGQWVVDVGHTKVPQGTSLLFIVTGPPGSNFSINMTGPPFGHTYPVYSAGFTTPNESLNRTGVETSINVSIPTDTLAIQGYDVNITAAPSGGVGGPWVTIGNYVVNVELAVDLQQLNDTIANQTQQIEIYKNDLEQFSNIVTFWTEVSQALAVFAGLVLTFSIVLVALRDRMARHPEFLARTRDAWKWFLYGSGIRTFTPELVDEAEPAPMMDPNRYFRGAYCNRCKRNAWARNEIVTHLLVDHADLLNGHPPEENTDYFADKKLLTEIQASRQPLKAGRRLQRARRDALAVDLDEVEEPDVDGTAQGSAA